MITGEDYEKSDLQILKNILYKKINWNVTIYVVAINIF